MNYYKEIQTIFKELHSDYPSYPLGRHIWLAFGEDVIGVLSDKQFYFTLLKYQQELSLGGDVSPSYVEDIIEDGTHLFDEIETDD